MQVLAIPGQNSRWPTRVPHSIVEDDLADGRLLTLLDDWTAPDIWLTLYYPPYEHLPLKVATFSEFFETYVLERWRVG